MKILEKTSLGSNGVGHVTMNYCCELQYKNTYFFVVCDKPETTRKEFEDICKVNHWPINYICSPVRHPFKYYKGVKSIIKNGNYDLYHINGNSGLMLLDVLVAKTEGIPVVTYCHNSSNRFKLLHYFLKPFLGLIKCTKLACSTESGNWAYGSKKYRLIKNAINYDKFQYNAIHRKEIRNKYDISDDEILILQVGNFNKEKNHFFTLDFFEELYRKNIKVKLLLCGDGILRDRILERLSEKKLKNSVIVAGSQRDIEKFYAAGDILVQPSLFEGLPLAVLEAQVSGLMCFVSANITRECSISERIMFLEINDSTLWSDCIEKNIVNNINTYSTRSIKPDESFNIKRQASKLQDIYRLTVEVGG